MTPTEFLIQHRQAVLSAFSGSPQKTWEKLIIEIPEIAEAMAFNSFKVIVKPFVETCQFFESGLNNGLNNDDQLNNRLNNESGLNVGLNKIIDELNTKLNTLERLNKKLNNDLVKYRLNIFDDDGGLNTRLNTMERLNAGLNNSDESGLNKKLNILGWTVTKSGNYFRAFRKIKGKLHGVHLGKTLDGAELKIQSKQSQI